MIHTLSRRDAMKLGGAAAVLAATGLGRAAEPSATAAGAGDLLGAFTDGQYTLPPLPYAAGALEPHLTGEILTIHHDKHHAGYVRGLNATLDKLAAARAGGDYAAIQDLSRLLAFHGSGHVLHTLFWHSMTPGGSAASDAFAAALARDFGSKDAFAAQFAAATKAVEGSGWGVLAHEPIGGKLLILQVENHQDLAIWGATPLLVCDVWEHAYYLQYKNDRGTWVDEFMTIANFDFASRRYVAATGA